MISHAGALFPLAGILGTILGLMLTMEFIAEAGVEDMAGMVGKFAIALTSTFWAIIMSLFIQVLGMPLEKALAPKSPFSEAR